MTSYLLDTSYVIALEASDDERHEQAIRHWRTFLPRRPRIVTTSLIFNDRVSFALMDVEGMRKALTFDLHFAQAGFHRLPEPPA